MKVGTDAVLLGAWAEANESPKNILDIGTGTGLIALIMAQRFSDSQITAVDIEPNAIREADQNFQRSQWSDRLRAIHTSVQSYEPDMKFDLIISNPPFFEFNFHGIDAERTMARQQSTLSFSELLTHSKWLMSRNGTLHYVIPFFEKLSFLEKASELGLEPFRLCDVKGNKSAQAKRTLVSLSQEDETLSEEELIIEIARHEYTDDYINLVKDFYLNM